MSNSNPFPVHPSPCLSREDVIGYLTELTNENRTVSQSSSGSDYYIQVNETQKITISQRAEGRWGLSIGNPGLSYPLGEADNLTSLRTIIQGQLGIAKPTSVRLYEPEPATNFSKLAGLIGRSLIEAVFDPYLDDVALQNLLTIAGLANASLSPSIRILTGQDRTVIPKSGIAKLSKPFVQAWLHQVGATAGEVRTKPYAGHQRRFLLLSGGRSLIFGMSLNAPSKNEAASVEVKPEDTTFFDSEWSTATIF